MDIKDDALMLANALVMLAHNNDEHLTSDEVKSLVLSETKLRDQHARIAELESEKARLIETYVPTNGGGKSYAAPSAQVVEPAAVATIWVEESGVIDFEVLPPCTLPPGEYSLYTQRAAPAPAAVAVPDGWREQFASKVYANLAAADNQDIPLEDYPARILKVLDSIVGPRHPAVIKWRNDAIQSCIAIAYRYCRDPESHKYLKQDLEALLAATPPAQAQDVQRDAVGFKTADGVNVLPGDKVWVRGSSGIHESTVDKAVTNYMLFSSPIPVDQSYSSESAIRAAIAASAAQKG